MSEWQPIASAPRNVPVMTKIDDDQGSRNEQGLKLGATNNLWWFEDGSMYVYYKPTHWMPLPDTSAMEQSNG